MPNFSEQSSENLPFALTPQRTGALVRSLKRLARPDVRMTSLALLTDAEIDLLVAEANRQEFRDATPEIAHKGRRVFQDFDVCFPAPRIGAFEALARLLEQGVNAASIQMTKPPLTETVIFEDFAIQRYPAGSRGIGIHRDGLRYRNLVAIITLAGQSRLFTCADRDGNGKRAVNDQPGRVVLLSANGFAGREDETARPLHGVDQVIGGRLSIGFRCAPRVAT